MMLTAGAVAVIPLIYISEATAATVTKLTAAGFHVVVNRTGAVTCGTEDPVVLAIWCMRVQLPKGPSGLGPGGTCVSVAVTAKR